MGHDASKVLFGTTQTSFKVVDNRAGVIQAGKIVNRKRKGRRYLKKSNKNVYDLFVFNIALIYN